MSSEARRQVLSNIKLVVNAGGAKPSPPVGPALGQAGLNIMAFCKDFNAKTAKYKDGVPLRVQVREGGVLGLGDSWREAAARRIHACHRFL